MAQSHSTPAGAGDDVSSTDPDEVKALLQEIFARTGQKVQADDPLVAAALIHSTLLRRAGHDAARAIERAAKSTRSPQPPGHDDLQRFIDWLGLWHTQVMLGTVLFAICFLASMLGNLVASNSCR